ncbi:MAG TPA: siderophore-interacting protein [Pseudonocardia sp.]|nr:siderophore-interacting protein [Pseudonocardia sp.]
MVRTWERVALKAFGVSTYRAEVESVAELTGWYRRITFSSTASVDLLPVFPTLWLRLWAPRTGGEPALQRAYTLVDVDAATGRFALDFVLHDAAGPAGERSLVRSVRAAFRDGLGLGRSEYFAHSYWIRTS